MNSLSLTGVVGISAHSISLYNEGVSKEPEHIAYVYI